MLEAVSLVMDCVIEVVLLNYLLSAYVVSVINKCQGTAPGIESFMLLRSDYHTLNIGTSSQ